MRRALLVVAICLVAGGFVWAQGSAAPKGVEYHASPDEGTAASPLPHAGSGPVIPSHPFPALALEVLHPGESAPEPMNLADDLRKHPIVLFYFKIGNRISEDIYLEVQDLVDKKTPGKVALYAVCRLGREFGLTELKDRMHLVGIRHPVILDETGAIQSALGLHFVPDITLINGQGELSFTGGRSLNHPAYGEITVGDAIVMAAKGEKPPARNIWKYNPADDFLGQAFRPMTLPAYDTGASLRLGDYVEHGKVTALFYWSPGDRFSRSVMPGVVTAYNTLTRKYLNVFSIARDGTPEEIRAVASSDKVAFPIAMNRDKEFTTKYRVLFTPTLIVIGPDGKIDKVVSDGTMNFYTVLAARVKALVLDHRAPASGAHASGQSPAHTR